VGAQFGDVPAGDGQDGLRQMFGFIRHARRVAKRGGGGDVN
jgi:hypothetical protein